MGAEKKKQLVTTAIFIVLICVFTGAGFWFRGHPLFTGQGPRWKTVDAPVSTYVPYEANDASPGQTAADAPNPVPAGDPPAAMTRFYTTERASVFTFSGLGNERELQSVLTALKETNSHATFFVTAEEMETLPDQITEILRGGHSLGISVLPAENAGSSQLLKAMQEQAELLRTRYSAYYEIFVRPTFGSGSPALLQAAAAGKFRVLTQLKEAVPEEVSRMTDAGEVLSVVFSENEGKLQRGEIVHFQMGLFQHSDTVLGELIERIVAEKCLYPIRSADELAENTEQQYVYPLPKDQILPSVKDRIYPGHLAGKTPEEAFEVIRSGYIGNYWVKPPDYFPGFSAQEAKQLDRNGLIENSENYVFLTFDDWGTDETVEKLLAVLQKHNATGTFFVRSQYVPFNPNLLRAIAEEGHTIAAHTHTHMPLSTETSPGTFVELTEEEQAALEKDLVTNYNTMQSIVGDLTDADGKPSLSRLFRPPTLAVGKRGLEAVFDCGFTHAIEGYYSTGDYAAFSARALANAIKQNLRSGSILVMHFSDNSQYTAEALDLVLTELESRGSKYRFVGLNKVLS